MLPFLKDRHEGSMSGPVENIKRASDDGEDEELDMLDAIAEDMITAIGKKDKQLLRGALDALVEHIQDLDFQQDEG